MAEPLTMMVITGISGVLGASAKGWDLYRKLKADSVRSRKKILVQLAASHNSGFLSRGTSESSIQEVYDALTEAQPFVSDLYRRQIFACSVAAGFCALLLFLLYYLATASSVGYWPWRWVVYSSAFVLAWLLSSTILENIGKLRKQKKLTSFNDAVNGLNALRMMSLDLVEKTRMQFSTQRPLFGLSALSDFEASFLKAYTELSGMMRSLELQALYLEFRKSSEAVHDYLGYHIAVQIADMLMAMVERQSLEPKPDKPDEIQGWEQRQRTNLKREFIANGMGKYLEIVDSDFWSVDFVRYSQGSQDMRISKLRACFPSFATK